MSDVRASVIGEAQVIGRMRHWTLSAVQNIRKAVSSSTVNVERGAKARCPVDTGRLRASIAKRFVDGDTAGEVGTNVVYARAVEFGTRFQRAQPYLGPAFEEEKPKFLRALRDAIRSAK